MEERLKKIAAKITGFWKSLSVKKRITVIVAFVSVATLIAVVLLATAHISYSPLYLGLDESEAGEILDKVQAMGVPIKVNGTGNLYVDSKQVDTVKMKLAEEGYPKSTLSYDVFMSGTNWAMTDSDKKKLALYQLQNRLQDTIKTIPGVENADVTIGQNNDNSYVLSADSGTVTASVKLNLTTGYNLSKDQVQGIALLVAKSVPDLDEKNVVVLNSDGTPLTGGDGSDDSYSTSRLQLEQKVEDMVKQKVLSVLEPVYGQGNVRAAAGATLNFSQSVTNKTEYTPNSNGLGVPQSTSRSVTNNGTGAGASGVAGITGTGQYTTSGTTASAVSGTVTNEQTDYLVDTLNQQIKDSGGTVSKLTVAVVLDSKTVAAANASDINSIKQTVAYSVGIDPASVSVQLAPFAAASAAQTSSGKAAPGVTMLMVAAGALALAVIAAAVILVAVMKRRSAKAIAAAQLPPNPAEVTVQQVENEDAKSIEDYMKDSEKNTVKKQIEDFTDNKPELVAQLLRNWLKD